MAARVERRVGAGRLHGACAKEKGQIILLFSLCTCLWGCRQRQQNAAGATYTYPLPT